ncbi:hypothetical protein M0804_004448 [Polistes exclamans]|nr:hypothetical protein M0804_004448 [Polistes exclamans]
MKKRLDENAHLPERLTNAYWLNYQAKRKEEKVELLHSPFIIILLDDASTKEIEYRRTVLLSLCISFLRTFVLCCQELSVFATLSGFHSNVTTKDAVRMFSLDVPIELLGTIKMNSKPLIVAVRRLKVFGLLSFRLEKVCKTTNRICYLIVFERKGSFSSTPEKSICVDTTIAVRKALRGLPTSTPRVPPLATCEYPISDLEPASSSLSDDDDDNDEDDDDNDDDDIQRLFEI